MPKFKTATVKEAKKRQPRTPKEETIDYSQYPTFTENEWYNIQIFGQKTAPKAR